MIDTASKTAVVLLNLGGPGKTQDIEPFLKNFFSDKNIIALPAAFRLPLARIIARRRARGVSLQNYSLLGGGSPLLENTKAQASALQTVLGDKFKLFVCMRYWHPMADQIAREVKDYAPQEIVLLPLYPQFSTATTKSSFQEWDRAAKKISLKTPSRRICCYPLEGGYVSASAQAIRDMQAHAVKEGHGSARVLFSAHGLPEKTIRAGDPYQWQCEQSAAAIARTAGLAAEQWRICYQSRVGPLKWIGPPLEEELKRAAADGVAVIIYPHSFVSEHVETLVELDIEFKHLAQTLGVPGYYRVQTVGTAPAFIEGLAQLVKRQEAGKRACPDGFGQCGLSDKTALEAA